MFVFFRTWHVSQKFPFMPAAAKSTKAGLNIVMKETFHEACGRLHINPGEAILGSRMFVANPNYEPIYAATILSIMANSIMHGNEIIQQPFE